MNYQSMRSELEKLAYAPPLSLPKGKLLKKLVRAHRLPKGSKERVDLAKRLKERRTRVKATPMSSSQASGYQSDLASARKRLLHKKILIGAGVGLTGAGAGLAIAHKNRKQDASA